MKKSGKVSTHILIGVVMEKLGDHDGRIGDAENNILLLKSFGGAIGGGSGVSSDGKSGSNG
jgi:hypothetical protein